MTGDDVPTVFRADDGREWRSDYAAAARPDARQVEEALAWFREDPAALDIISNSSAKSYRYAAVLVRAALAAGPDEGLRQGIRHALGIDADVQVDDTGLIADVRERFRWAQLCHDEHQITAAGDGIDPTIASGYRLEDIRGYSPRDLGFGADGHSDEQAGGEQP